MIYNASRMQCFTHATLQSSILATIYSASIATRSHNWRPCKWHPQKWHRHKTNLTNTIITSTIITIVTPAHDITHIAVTASSSTQIAILDIQLLQLAYYSWHFRQVASPWLMLPLLWIIWVHSKALSTLKWRYLELVSLLKLRSYHRYPSICADICTITTFTVLANARKYWHQVSRHYNYCPEGTLPCSILTLY